MASQNPRQPLPFGARIGRPVRPETIASRKIQSKYTKLTLRSLLNFLLVENKLYLQAKLLFLRAPTEVGRNQLKITFERCSLFSFFLSGLEF